MRANAFALCVAMHAFMLSGCHSSAAPESASTVNNAPEVSVETVATTSLPLTLNYAGHTAGSREVEVRARISGILLARRFQEGKPVAQGQVLFELDAEPARAALAQAQAELAMQRAQAAQAKRESDRIVAMSVQGLVSQLQRDQSLSVAEIATANVLAAEARLRKAQLDLSYCEVRAPISGLASNEARSEGSLVTAGAESSLLTRIVQADPLYVEFTVPDFEAIPLRTALNATLNKGSAVKPLQVRVELADGSQYGEVAQLDFLDNAVDAQSGSVAARATLRNATHTLLPGQFVRVHIDGLKVADVIGLPRKAVLTNGEGYFVWLLDQQNTPTQHRVLLGTAVGDRVIIKSGLVAGDRIIVDGTVKVAAGERVNVVNSALAATSNGGATGSRLVKSIE